MSDIILSSGFILNVLLLAIFFPIGIWLMRWQDRKMGYGKEITYKWIYKSSNSVAIYQGMKLVAFAIAMAALIG